MCEVANEVECAKCGTQWEPEDTNTPGRCPECGAYECQVNRCDRCPLNDLDHVRSNSSAGRLLERVLQLDFNTEHFAVSWADVSAEEVRGLQILKEERNRWDREKRDEAANR